MNTVYPSVLTSNHEFGALQKCLGLIFFYTFHFIMKGKYDSFCANNNETC